VSRLAQWRSTGGGCRRLPVCATVLWVLFSSTAASQTVLEFGVEIGAGYSDNIDRIEDGGRDETIASARIGGESTIRSDLVSADVLWGIGGLSYIDETYDDELTAYLNGQAAFQLSRNIDWLVEDNLGRILVDPFEVTHPENREYVNYFSTGPQMIVGLTDRWDLVATATFSDIWYELTELSNQRLDGRLGFRTGTQAGFITIFSAGGRVEFDDTTNQEDFTHTEAGFLYEVVLSRSTINATLGWAAINDLENEGSGPLVEFEWRRELSPSADIALEFGTKYSDAGQIFRFSQDRSLSMTGTSDIISSGEPFTTTYAGLSFTTQSQSTALDLSVLWIEEDYETTVGLSRTMPTVQLNFTKNLSRRWRLDFFGDYSKRKFVDQGREDTDWLAGVVGRLRFGRAITLSLSLSRYERSSNLATSFDENRVLLTIGFGEILQR